MGGIEKKYYEAEKPQTVGNLYINKATVVNLFWNDGL